MRGGISVIETTTVFGTRLRLCRLRNSGTYSAESEPAPRWGRRLEWVALASPINEGIRRPPWQSLLIRTAGYLGIPAVFGHCLAVYARDTSASRPFLLSLKRWVRALISSPLKKTRRWCRLARGSKGRGSEVGTRSAASASRPRVWVAVSLPVGA